MKNLTNSINNDEALKALEQSVEQQLAGYAMFPFDFYREDGSYISMFEAYKQSIINAISLGIIKPTGDIITQMNMTPDEVRAAGLYYPLPCEPTGEIMDIIKQHQGGA